MSDLVRAPLVSTVSESELQKHMLSALSVILLEQLAEAVPRNPDVLTRHYAVLAALARDRVAPEELARIDAAIAAAAIEAAPDGWRNWEAILNRGMESRDALAVLRIVDAYDTCANRELKKVLGERLLARTGVSAAGLPQTQYADAMRTALGGVATPEANNRARWLKLDSRAATELANLPTDDDVAQVRSVAELAWHTNLALALAAPRSNPGQFDLWLAAGKPWNNTSTNDEEEPPPRDSLIPFTSDRLSRDQQDTFDRYVHELGDWQRVEEPRRASYLRGIAQVAPRLNDIPPSQARSLSIYLLAQKGDGEQRTILENASALKWKQLRLALADGVERSKLAAEPLRRLVIVFSGQEIPEIETNRAAARQALLRSVALELSSPTTGNAQADRANELDRWAGELATLFRERARLLGATPSELENATTASEFLRLCALHLAPAGESAIRGSGTQSAGDDSARLIESADSLGQSDAQRTVILQRAMIFRSLADVARRNPEQHASGAKLVDAYLHRTATAKSAVTQLRDGEATLLSLWMLWKES